MSELEHSASPLIETTKDTWYCYLLRNTSEQFKMCTYNGSTNDLKRRLRQHNEEIKGGAKATHGKNNSWDELYTSNK